MSGDADQPRRESAVPAIKPPLDDAFPRPRQHSTTDRRVPRQISPSSQEHLTDEPTRSARGRHSRQAPRRAVVAVGALVVAVLMALVVASLLGWHCRVVNQTDGGVSAPPGTLVISRDVSAAHVQEGQLVVVTAPGQSTFVTQVDKVTPDRVITRRPLLVQPDAQAISSSSSIQRVVTGVWPLGWVLSVLGLSLGGVGLSWLLTRPITSVAHRLRWWWCGAALCTVLSAVAVQPWARVEVLGPDIAPSAAPATSTTSSEGQVIVSTGLLPARVPVGDTSEYVLEPGEFAVMDVTDPADTAWSATQAPTIRPAWGMAGWWLLAIGAAVIVTGWWAFLTASRRSQPRINLGVPVRNQIRRRATDLE